MDAWLTPLLDAELMRATDRWAIEEIGVPSLELMEAAGAGLAGGVEDVAGSGPVRVVCGKGNNGGDGLVAARVLASTGFEVEALLLNDPQELSPDAAVNLKRFADARRVDAGELDHALESSGAVVDAILGTGSGGEPRGPAAAAIDAINACGAPVVAADLPTGVDASTGEVPGAAVDARLTVTFHAAKPGHWIAPGKWKTGELRVAPIGIPEGAPGEPSIGLIAPGVLSLAPTRGAQSTKFSSGQVLIAGGSRGLTGAVCLSALAAIRSGAGYATVAVPAELEQIFEVKLTEVMSVGCPDDAGMFAAAAADPILSAAAGAAAVVLGAGLGRGQGPSSVVRSLVGRINAPLVIDADGLNALGGHVDLVADRTPATVLTPHAGELARLLGTDSTEINAQRLAHAKETARQSGAIVVLKGDDTIVTDGQRVAVNALSSPGLATAGTGDVLGGLIGALLARGLDAFTAASAGVLAHARAGVFAAERVGVTSVIAGDVIEALPDGLRPPATESR